MGVHYGSTPIHWLRAGGTLRFRFSNLTILVYKNVKSKKVLNSGHQSVGNYHNSKQKTATEFSKQLIG